MSTHLSGLFRCEYLRQIWAMIYIDARVSTDAHHFGNQVARLKAAGLAMTQARR